MWGQPLVMKIRLVTQKGGELKEKGKITKISKFKFFMNQLFRFLDPVQELLIKVVDILPIDFLGKINHLMRRQRIRKGMLC